MSTAIKSEAQTTGTLFLRFSLSCQSVDQQQRLAHAPRLAPARRRPAATRPPETGRCDYGSWHLARLLSVKQTGMGPDRASAVAPAQGALAVSQHKGAENPISLCLLPQLSLRNHAPPKPAAATVTSHHRPTGETASAQQHRGRRGKDRALVLAS